LASFRKVHQELRVIVIWASNRSVIHTVKAAGIRSFSWRR